MPEFLFQPKWKEELICSADGQQFILEFPMGSPTVYLPTKESWQAKAPQWASPHWTELFDQLSSWSKANNVQLVVDETAQVYQ